MEDYKPVWELVASKGKTDPRMYRASERRPGWRDRLKDWWYDGMVWRRIDTTENQSVAEGD